MSFLSEEGKKARRNGGKNERWKRERERERKASDRRESMKKRDFT